MRSAASAEDFPRDGAPEIALVGRSNVGKSSLINALVKQRIARTSAAPGKTRLANIYRVGSLYLVDLPGYGYARGSTRDFDAIASAAVTRASGALLLVDARHPGLAHDVSAWKWLTDTVAAHLLVATKIDKLSRAERLRAMERIEAVFQHPATAVSAETGEGMEDLWKLIDRLANNNNNNNSNRQAPRRPSPPPSPTAAAATDRRRPRRRRPRS